MQLELPSSATAESLPLTSERNFGVLLTIDGASCPALHFRSPVNDEQWREFTRQLRECNVRRDRSTGYHGAEAIRSLGSTLYAALATLSPLLSAFLMERNARRLVIATSRPEIHVLPWGALCTPEGSLLASEDLSIVQCWGVFSDHPRVTGRTLNLVSVLGSNTNKVTGSPLRTLPPEITRKPEAAVDILHMEEHGNAVLGSIGGVSGAVAARKYAHATLALLWSCYSSAANSWGESPALALHRLGAGLVLSFQAELHTLDARNIAQAFYADVFGPAAGRDPETALVRIRATRFAEEYEFANWASMVVFLRSPLDLSALPLNGPRVPAACWYEPPREDAAWRGVAAVVRTLTPGAVAGLAHPQSVGGETRVPLAPFAPWRGNVILLDGAGALPLRDAVLSELNLPRARAGGKVDTVAQLLQFFDHIERYGAPLLVWTAATPFHRDFLIAVKPPRSLTFLLLYAEPSAATFESLVDANNLQQARAVFEAMPPGQTQGLVSLAYSAYARSEMPREAAACITALHEPAERALLTGNFVSRFCHLPEAAQAALSEVQSRNLQEDLYREALLSALAAENYALAGSAQHQLAYLMHTAGRSSEAEVLYRDAFATMERVTREDRGWSRTSGMILRDWADLLAGDLSRCEDAESHLARALAMHTYYGRVVETAYALVTSARIAQTRGAHSTAVDRAVDAANRFEACANWRGWVSAIVLLLQVLSEAEQPQRMLRVADHALAKLAVSNLQPRQLRTAEWKVNAYRARAQWIAGELTSLRQLADALLVEGEEVASEEFTLLDQLRQIQQFLGLANDSQRDPR